MRRLAQAVAGVSPAQQLDRAAALFAQPDWLDALLAPLVTAIGADDWCEPPLRVTRDAARSGAILYEHAGLAIGLSQVRPVAAIPATIVFSGQRRVQCYLQAGRARLHRWAAAPLPEPCVAARIAPARRLRDLVLRDGMVVRHDGRRRAQAITGGAGALLILTATRRSASDPVAREHDAATGAFRRMATNDEGAARAQLLLAFLRAAEAPAADARFAAASRDPAFFLRWSAMREWLAHDAPAAWPRLAEMAADDPHPDVRAAAAATLAAHTARAAA